VVGGDVTVEVVIEVSRGDLIKRDGGGQVELISPVPCPFNYGSVVGTTAEDGDPIDVVVLGPRLARGHLGNHQVVGTVLFVDAGCRDDKWVCGTRPLRRGEQMALVTFFAAYALFKRVVNAARRRAGPTSFGGVKRCGTRRAAPDS
jgi:inorganic pyrophosphatase